MYNWDLEELKRRKESLIEIKKKRKKKLSESDLLVINESIATYNFLLGNFESDDFDYYDADISDRVFVSRYFINMYKNINPMIITSTVDSCPIFESFNPKERLSLSQNKLDSSSVIDICRDIFSTFNDPTLMDKVNKILDPSNHLLDISSSDELINFQTLYSGFSVKDFYNRIGYAKIYSNQKIRDLYTLVHEIFHLVIEDGNKPLSYDEDRYYLEEVEGAFSDLIVTDYLYNNHIFIDDARDVELMNYDTSKEFIRNLYISHNFHSYFKEDKFDLKRIKKEMLSNGLRFIGFDNLLIRDNLNSFNRDLCYGFSYLVALDLFFKYKNGYKNIIGDLEGISKGKNPFILFDRYNITFHKDGYKNLDSYQKILKKRDK